MWEIRINHKSNLDRTILQQFTLDRLHVARQGWGEKEKKKKKEENRKNKRNQLGVGKSKRALSILSFFCLLFSDYKRTLQNVCPPDNSVHVCSFVSTVVYSFVPHIPAASIP